MNKNELIAIGLILAVVLVGAGPLILAHHLAVRAHREQFKATGAAEFSLPSDRDIEREHVERCADLDAARGRGRLHEESRRIWDTDTGELIRLNADGEPLTPADLAARTAPTAYTVDQNRLAEILQLEPTSEYPLSHETFVEIGAAEAFVKDPLGSTVLPPIHLMEDAGSPVLAVTFWSMVENLTTDWDPADSEFRFWDRDTPLVDA